MRDVYTWSLVKIDGASTVDAPECSHSIGPNNPKSSHYPFFMKLSDSFSFLQLPLFLIPSIFLI